MGAPEEKDRAGGYGSSQAMGEILIPCLTSYKPFLLPRASSLNSCNKTFLYHKYWCDKYPRGYKVLVF